MASASPPTSRQTNCNSRQRTFAPTAAADKVVCQGTTHPADQPQRCRQQPAGRTHRSHRHSPEQPHHRTDIRNDVYRKAINNWDRYGRGWYSGSGWYNNCPWRYGWYGGSYWNNCFASARAAAWGLAGLATFSVINSLVNSGAANRSATIMPSLIISFEPPDNYNSHQYAVTFGTTTVIETKRYPANRGKVAHLQWRTPRDAGEAQPSSPPASGF